MACSTPGFPALPHHLPRFVQEAYSLSSGVLGGGYLLLELILLSRVQCRNLFKMLRINSIVYYWGGMWLVLCANLAVTRCTDIWSTVSLDVSVKVISFF